MCVCVCRNGWHDPLSWVDLPASTLSFLLSSWSQHTMNSCGRFWSACVAVGTMWLLRDSCTTFLACIKILGGVTASCSSSCSQDWSHFTDTAFTCDISPVYAHSSGASKRRKTAVPASTLGQCTRWLLMKGCSQCSGVFFASHFW